MANIRPRVGVTKASPAITRVFDDYLTSRAAEVLAVEESTYKTAAYGGIASRVCLTVAISPSGGSVVIA
jgi:hypothetical protein